MTNPAERLCKFVMAEYGRRMTPAQIRMPWFHLGSHAGEITGVVVPADGDSPRIRVTLADVDGAAAYAPPALELT